MKKIIISVAAVVLLVLIAVIVVWGFGLFLTASPKLDSVFPENTVLFCQLTDRMIAEKNLKTTKFFSAFEQSAFEGKADLKGLLDEKARKMELGEFAKLMDFFRHGSAIGVFDVDMGEHRFNIAFAGDISKDSNGFEEFLNREFRLMLEKKFGEVREEKFDSEIIFSFKGWDNKQAGYAVVKDYFILGYPVKAVETSILSLKRKSGKVLADNANYRGVKKELRASGGVFVFVDLEKLIADALKAPGKKALPFQADKYLKLSGIDAFKAAGYNSVIKEGFFEDSSYMNIDFGSEGVLPALMNVQPRKIGKSGRFIPARFSVVSVSSIGDLSEGWEDILERIRKNLDDSVWQNVNNGVNFVEKGLNFNIREDLLGTVMNEVAVGFCSPDVPAREGRDEMLKTLDEYEIIIATEIKDRKSLDSTLERFGYMGLAEMSSKTYRECELKTFETSLTDMKLSPSFAFVDDFIVLAQSRETLESAIDSYLDKKSAVDDKDWAEAENLFHGKVNQLAMFGNESCGNTVASLMRLCPEYGNWSKKFGFEPADEMRMIIYSLPSPVSSAVKREKGYYSMIKSPYPVFLDLFSNSFMRWYFECPMDEPVSDFGEDTPDGDSDGNNIPLND